MRIRTIKPEFFKHEEVATLEPLTRLLFIGLWCLADRAGRLEDRPKRIHVEILPYDISAPVDAMLDDLRSIRLIQRYEVGGVRLIEIPAFSRHQRITGKESESPSKFPPFSPEHSMQTTGKQPGNIGETTGKQPGNNREKHGVCGDTYGEGLVDPEVSGVGPFLGKFSGDIPKVDNCSYVSNSEPIGETTGKQPGNNRETTETTGRERERERERNLYPSPEALETTNEPTPVSASPITAPISKTVADEIYAIYPRKQGRAHALKAIANALKQCEASSLMAKTAAYAKAVAAWNDFDRRFIPHPASWFNAACYDDDQKTWERSYANPNQQRSSTDDDHRNGGGWNFEGDTKFQ